MTTLHTHERADAVKIDEPFCVVIRETSVVFTRYGHVLLQLRKTTYAALNAIGGRL